jgi:hypothetical protein
MSRIEDANPKIEYRVITSADLKAFREELHKSGLEGFQVVTHTSATAAAGQFVQSVILQRPVPTGASVGFGAADV